MWHSNEKGTTLSLSLRELSFHQIQFSLKRYTHLILFFKWIDKKVLFLFDRRKYFCLCISFFKLFIFQDEPTDDLTNNKRPSIQVLHFQRIKYSTLYSRNCFKSKSFLTKFFFSVFVIFKNSLKCLSLFSFMKAPHFY